MPQEKKQIYKSFKPQLTPKEMLHRGIFGGIYFNDMTHFNDFPKDWFERLDKSFYLSDRYSVSVNYFKVKSGLSREEWKKNGWKFIIFWSQKERKYAGHYGSQRTIR